MKPEQIKQIRVDLNLSQSEFARRLDVSRGAVGQWETGDTTPSPQNAEKIAALAPVHAVRLMNSAMMPADGTYTRRRIDKMELAQRVWQAHHNGKLISYIGYPETAEFLSQLSNVLIPVNRELATFTDGDEGLVCKLNYRVKPGEKGRPINVEDFEFFHITYKENI